MATEESYCKLVERSSFTESANFSYDTLDIETRFLVGQRTSEIKNLIHRSAQDIFDIGQKLTEVKEKLGHGKFANWLNAEFNWSQSAAQKFMQVARQFKMVNFTDLNIATSALYLLASSSASFTARQEALELARQGKVISYSKAKSIIAQNKDTSNRDLVKQVTVDVPAETVNEGSATIIQQKLKDTKPLGLLPDYGDKRSLIHSANHISIEAVKTCTKFINTVEGMDSQLLESMNDAALKLLINKSNLLAKKAKMLLTQRWQSGIQK